MPSSANPWIYAADRVARTPGRTSTASARRSRVESPWFTSLEGVRERAFLERIRSGDPEAKTEFVVAHHPRCATLAEQRGVPYGDSEDIAQESLFAAIIQIEGGQFRFEAPVQGWLAGIVRCRTARYFRERQRDLPSVVTLHDISLSTRSAVEKSILFHEAISHLGSTKHRKVFVLNTVGGYTIAEISKMMRHSGCSTRGVSPGRIGSVLSEAKAQFAHVYCGSEKQRSSGPRTRMNEKPATNDMVTAATTGIRAQQVAHLSPAAKIPMS
jgi:DNA-directed RNA polymerase specialized sigma24 family protein